jgi:hypothetical protein
VSPWGRPGLGLPCRGGCETGRRRGGRAADAEIPPRRCAGARRHWAVGVRPGRSPLKRCGRAETTCRCTAAPPPAEEDRRLRDTGGQVRAVGGGRSCGLRSSWGLGTRGQCTRPRCPAWDNWKIGRLKLKWDGPNSKKKDPVNCFWARSVGSPGPTWTTHWVRHCSRPPRRRGPVQRRSRGLVRG